MRLSGTRLRSLTRSLPYLRHNAVCLQSIVPYEITQIHRTRAPLSFLPCTRLHGFLAEVGNKGSKAASHARDLQSEVGFHGVCRGFFSFGDGDEDRDLTKHYEESRVIGYSPEQLFAVVAAVDLYEDFVPWCQRSTVLWRKNHEALEAELEIGFKFLVERYISHVSMKYPSHIKTTASQSTIFEHLINIWEFKPGPTPNSCALHFLVDFQFRSPLYRKVANLFFNEVVAKLVSSFENRCRQVYGPSADTMAKPRS